MSKAEIKESARCGYEGKLEGDPDSQVFTSQECKTALVVTFPTDLVLVKALVLLRRSCMELVMESVMRSVMGSVGSVLGSAMELIMGFFLVSVCLVIALTKCLKGLPEVYRIAFTSEILKWQSVSE